MKMQKEVLLNYIKNIILANPDLKSALSTREITLQSTINDDLGFDSILSIAFLCELQSEYAYLNEIHLSKWRTLEDCIDTILKEKAS
ncbi:MAG: hypothetical protein IPM57_11265 [Oligoflexia bacterium]|nr:hypothetical protein [Oligoflexia bacterium]